jgi:hypothetical protein
MLSVRWGDFLIGTLHLLRLCSLPPVWESIHFGMVPVFLNFKRAQESIPPAYVARARIFKRLKSPGIDSKESIPPGWE